MTRKTWWLGLGLAILLGCDSKPDQEVNNTIPPSPPGTKHNSAPPPPGTMTQMPGNYPGANPQGDAAKPAEDAKTEEGAKAEAPKTDDTAKPEAPKEENKGEAPKAADVTLSSEEIAEIKKLPEADQAQALKQKVCPVSEDHLGSMEVPVKVTAGGETFFLCCAGCKKDLKDDAKLQQYLAKLKK